LKDRPLLEVDEVGFKEKNLLLVGNGHVSNLGQTPEIGHHFPKKNRVSGINLWVDDG